MKELDLRADEIRIREEEARDKLTTSEEARERHEAEFHRLQEQYQALEATVRERTQRIETLGTEAARLRETVARAENEMRMAEAIIEGRRQDREEAEQIIAQLDHDREQHLTCHVELKARADEQAGRIEAQQAALMAE